MGGFKINNRLRISDKQFQPTVCVYLKDFYPFDNEIVYTHRGYNTNDNVFLPMSIKDAKEFRKRLAKAIEQAKSKDKE